MHHPLRADLFTFRLKITYRLKSVIPKLNLCRVDSWHISRLTHSVITDKLAQLTFQLIRVNRFYLQTCHSRKSMNQRTKNCDNVLRSEFYHYSQRNYHNMIALFLWAQFAMLLWMKMSSAPVTFTSRRASRETVDFYIWVICSKTDNIKNLRNVIAIMY